MLVEAQYNIIEEKKLCLSFLYLLIPPVVGGLDTRSIKDHIATVEQTKYYNSLVDLVRQPGIPRSFKPVTYPYPLLDLLGI